MNPLDDIPFDVNELRSQPEFNWDCIDGIDQIHKDIIKQYERIILTIVNPLTKVQNNITNVGRSVANFAASKIPHIQRTIDKTDSTIVSKLNESLAPLATKFGNPGSSAMYWIVYRQIHCNVWEAVIEPWVIPPSDRTTYGPYKAACALMEAMCTLRELPHNTINMPQYEDFLKVLLDNAYQLAAMAGYENESVCDGMSFCGISVGDGAMLVEQALTCNLPEGESPTPIEPTPIEPTPIEPTPIEPTPTKPPTTPITNTCPAPVVNCPPSQVLVQPVINVPPCPTGQTPTALGDSDTVSVTGMNEEQYEMSPVYISDANNYLVWLSQLAGSSEPPETIVTGLQVIQSIIHRPKVTETNQQFVREIV